jgi:hypothetical protein
MERKEGRRKQERKETQNERNERKEMRKGGKEGKETNGKNEKTGRHGGKVLKKRATGKEGKKKTNVKKARKRINRTETPIYTCIFITDIHLYKNTIERKRRKERKEGNIRDQRRESEGGRDLVREER